MGWNHQLAKCWLQLLPTFNSKQTSKQTSGFNLDKSNKLEKRKKNTSVLPKLKLTSENYTFTNYLLIFTVHPDPWEKNPSCLRAHILYNFLPGLVQLQPPTFENGRPFSAEFRTCAFFQTNKGWRKAHLFTHGVWIPASRSIFEKKISPVFGWRILLGNLPLDFSDRGICYGKKGGQPCFFRGFRSFTCLNSSQFFFYAVCLRVKGKHWWQGKKVARNILFFSALYLVMSKWSQWMTLFSLLNDEQRVATKLGLIIN